MRSWKRRGCLGWSLIVALGASCSSPAPITEPAPPDPGRQAEEAQRAEASRLDALGGGGVVLEPGRFTRGCTPGQGDQCYASERPAHSVELTRRVWVAKTELTQAQYEAVTGHNPSKHLGAEHPVEQLNWFEALAFANALSLEAGLEPCYEGSGSDWSWPKGLDCLGFRLPTEAEWEYAARGGQDSLYAGGDALQDLGWTAESGAQQTQPVGQKMPNAYGIYDLSGSVMEWVWDRYQPYASEALIDPTGASEGRERLYRGGSWAHEARLARVTRRKRVFPETYGEDIGLRLFRTVP